MTSPHRAAVPATLEWRTVYSRFQGWREAGVWARILADLQAASDRRGKLDWQIHFVDGTIVRAHQHAAGTKSHHFRVFLRRRGTRITIPH